MTVPPDDTDPSIVQDIQTHVRRLEDRITIMEHRMALLEQDLPALLGSLVPARHAERGTTPAWQPLKLASGP